MQFNPIIPELSVANLRNSLKFYVETIGFRIEYRRDESNFAFLALDGYQLMLEEQNGNWETAILEYPFGRGINFQIMVPKIDPLVHALITAGYPLMKAQWESWYRVNDWHKGQKQFLVQDPDGYLLRFA